MSIVAPLSSNHAWGSRPRRRHRRRGGARGRGSPRPRRPLRLDGRQALVVQLDRDVHDVPSASANDSAWTARSPRSRGARGKASTMSVRAAFVGEGGHREQLAGGCTTCTVPTGPRTAGPDPRPPRRSARREIEPEAGPRPGRGPGRGCPRSPIRIKSQKPKKKIGRDRHLSGPIGAPRRAGIPPSAWEIARRLRPPAMARMSVPPAPQPADARRFPEELGCRDTRATASEVDAATACALPRFLAQDHPRRDGPGAGRGPSGRVTEAARVFPGTSETMSARPSTSLPPRRARR